VWDAVLFVKHGIFQHCILKFELQIPEDFSADNHTPVRICNNMPHPYVARLPGVDPTLMASTLQQFPLQPRPLVSHFLGYLAIIVARAVSV